MQIRPPSRLSYIRARAGKGPRRREVWCRSLGLRQGGLISGIEVEFGNGGAAQVNCYNGHLLYCKNINKSIDILLPQRLPVVRSTVVPCIDFC